MPPHLYGELARTIEGCEILARRRVVQDLLCRAHVTYEKASFADINTLGGANSTAAASGELQGLLWALGHIGASELGYSMICQ
ncbi:hypothetical protein B484DRAFT_390277, partial [Ochromonadaceae sp. CCMP2298]